MNTVNNRKICKLFNLYTVIFNMHVTVLSRKLLVTRLKERTGLITFFHKKVSGYHWGWGSLFNAGFTVKSYQKVGYLLLVFLWFIKHFRLVRCKFVGSGEQVMRVFWSVRVTSSGVCQFWKKRKQWSPTTTWSPWRWSFSKHTKWRIRERRGKSIDQNSRLILFCRAFFLSFRYYELGSTLRTGSNHSCAIVLRLSRA